MIFIMLVYFYQNIETLSVNTIETTVENTFVILKHLLKKRLNLTLCTINTIKVHVYI